MGKGKMGKWKKKRSATGGWRRSKSRSKTRANRGRRLKTRVTRALKSKARREKEMRAFREKQTLASQERGFRRRQLLNALDVPQIELPSIFFYSFPDVVVGGKYTLLVGFPEVFPKNMLGLGRRGI